MTFSASSSRDPGDAADVFAALPSQRAGAWTGESVGAYPLPDAADGTPDLESDGDWLDPENPPGDRISCVEEDGQLLIGIRCGTNEQVSWLGALVVVLCVVDCGLTFYFAAQNRLGIEESVILFAGWATFLSTLGYWVRARFGNTVVLIDPERILERSSLLGVNWRKEYALASFSKARLVIAHTQDEEPVYAVSIATLDERRPQFGAFLRREEKVWLVRRVNCFLGRDDGLAYGSYMDPNPTGEQWTLVGGFEFFDE